MPSATTLSNLSFHNAGPLTTTYTAPASCASADPDHMMMGPRYLPGNFQYGVCATEKGDCYPSGSAIDALNAKDSLQADARLDYFSPGLHCPHGWTTVGAATKNAEGVITSSGPAFTFPSTTQTLEIDRTTSTLHTTKTARLEDVSFFGYPARHALLGAMDRGETVIMCCPSSMTAHALNAPCYEALPSAPVRTSVCYAHSASEYSQVYTQASLFGTTVSAVELKPTATTGQFSVKTMSLPTESQAGLIAYTVMPMVALVHRASDATAAGDGTKTGGEGGSSSSPSNSPNSAAMAGRPPFQMARLGEVSTWVLTTLVGVAAGFALVLA
ncbi:hypothetical protein PG999_008458 [Apiospora kogelbergensis]|uniref:Uncharacterized protein n=1 Tax=Apiospora kogelbergensis TaxID=1337665 RepID=A0AAW0QHZ3_9PEZI